MDYGSSTHAKNVLFVASRQRGWHVNTLLQKHTCPSCPFHWCTALHEIGDWMHRLELDMAPHPTCRVTPGIQFRIIQRDYNRNVSVRLRRWRALVLVIGECNLGNRNLHNLTIMQKQAYSEQPGESENDRKESHCCEREGDGMTTRQCTCGQSSQLSMPANMAAIPY